MPYVQLDDRYSDHPKIVALSDKAYRLHTNGIVYCNRMLTDGFVPKQVLGTLLPTGEINETLASLLLAQIWSVLPDEKGYLIRDFLDWNLSKSQRASLSKKRARAGKKGGMAKQASAKQVSVASVKQTPLAKSWQSSPLLSEGSPPCPPGGAFAIFAAEVWEGHYGKPPTWADGARATFDELEALLGLDEACSRWTSYLADTGDYFQGHAPGKFRAQLDRWAAVVDDGAIRPGEDLEQWLARTGPQ